MRPRTLAGMAAASSMPMAAMPRSGLTRVVYRSVPIKGLGDYYKGPNGRLSGLV